MTAPTTIGLLFVFATGLAALAYHFRVPFTAALAFGALALGALHLVEPAHPQGKTLVTLVLPGLLFRAAYHLPLDQFRSHWRAIVSLSVLGMVASIAIAAITATVLFRLLDAGPVYSWPLALVLAILTVSTDSVGIGPLLRASRAPTSFTASLDGESVFTQGASVVCLAMVLPYAATTETNVGAIVTTVAGHIAGGVALGTLAGFAAAWLLTPADDSMASITVTVAASYGVFVLGEQLWSSGAVATVVSGMICGAGMPRSASIGIAVKAFWDYVALALNAVVFLLAGLSVPLDSLADLWLEIIAVCAALVVARVLVVYGLSRVFPRSDGQVRAAWRFLLIWGGARGALPVVLALTLALDFPLRERLQVTTFGVVLLLVAAQVITLRWIPQRGQLRPATGAL